MNYCVFVCLCSIFVAHLVSVHSPRRRNLASASLSVALTSALCVEVYAVPVRTVHTSCTNLVERACRPLPVPVPVLYRYKYRYSTGQDWLQRAGHSEGSDLAANTRARMTEKATFLKLCH